MSIEKEKDAAIVALGRSIFGMMFTIPLIANEGEGLP